MTNIKFLAEQYNKLLMDIEKLKKDEIGKDVIADLDKTVDIIKAFKESLIQIEDNVTSLDDRLTKEPDVVSYIEAQAKRSGYIEVLTIIDSQLSEV